MFSQIFSISVSPIAFADVQPKRKLFELVEEGKHFPRTAVGICGDLRSCHTLQCEAGNRNASK
jgi:hypothetical protein